MLSVGAHLVPDLVVSLAIVIEDERTVSSDSNAMDIDVLIVVKRADQCAKLIYV